MKTAFFPLVIDFVLIFLFGKITCLILSSFYSTYFHNSRPYTSLLCASFVHIHFYLVLHLVLWRSTWLFYLSIAESSTLSLTYTSTTFYLPHQSFLYICILLRFTHFYFALTFHSSTFTSSLSPPPPSLLLPLLLPLLHLSLTRNTVILTVPTSLSSSHAPPLRLPSSSRSHRYS